MDVTRPPRRRKSGDRINAMLSGGGWNLRKLWRELVENPRLALPT